MSLRVIGAGFGRTGTMSLKLALEQLGFAKCHHMAEVFANPGHDRLFLDAATMGAQPWDELYDGYRAAVDWPSCHFWQELMDHYPDAKVILSLRDPESWYKSFTGTILNHIKAPVAEEGPMAVWGQMVQEIITRRTFDGNLDDKDHILRVYDAHNRRVQETVPAERLLVYRPGDGWEPLCAFLGVPVPEEPYPHTNTTEDFLVMTAQRFGTPADEASGNGT